jgi:hypothetical protein
MQLFDGSFALFEKGAMKSLWRFALSFMRAL